MPLYPRGLCEPGEADQAQVIALARHGVSREVPCSALKGDDGPYDLYSLPFWMGERERKPAARHGGPRTVRDGEMGHGRREGAE